MSLKKQILSQLSLFTSLSTLFCCALPSLMVILGFGAVFSSLIGFFPQIIWFSEHKILVFTVSGILIFINWIIYLKTKSIQACELAKNITTTPCDDSKTFSSYILFLSTTLWIIGFFFAFLVKYLI